MDTKTLKCCGRKKPYSTPRCEELDCYAVQSVLTTSYIEPNYKTDETFDGDFNAREGSDFEEDDDGF